MQKQPRSVLFVVNRPQAPVSVFHLLAQRTPVARSQPRVSKFVETNLYEAMQQIKLFVLFVFFVVNRTRKNVQNTKRHPSITDKLHFCNIAKCKFLAWHRFFSVFRLARLQHGVALIHAAAFINHD